MAQVETLEIPIEGMDCAECALHVQHAIEKLPGVDSVQVFLVGEKAVVRLDPALVDLPEIRQAVAGAGGYRVADSALGAAPGALTRYTRRLWTVLGLVFGAVLFVVVVGEWLGLFEQVTELVPFWLGCALVVAAGWPIFRNVVRAALNRQVTSHTLMTLGVIAALAIGQWATAAVVVFFMRLGDFVEKLTAEGRGEPCGSSPRWRPRRRAWKWMVARKRCQLPRCAAKPSSSCGPARRSRWMAWW